MPISSRRPGSSGNPIRRKYDSRKARVSIERRRATHYKFVTGMDFRTRTRGTARQIGKKFPVAGTPFKQLPKLDIGNARKIMAARKTVKEQEKLASGLTRLQEKIESAKTIAGGATMDSVDKALNMLEKECGISGSTNATVAFSAPKSGLLSSIPSFRECRQQVWVARYAWNAARAAKDVERQQLLLDEAVRAILSIDSGKIEQQIRVVQQVVPGRLSEEEVRRREIAKKMGITRAVEKGQETYQSILARINEMRRAAAPRKAKLEEKLKEVIAETPRSAEEALARASKWRHRAEVNETEARMESGEKLP